MDIYHSIKTTKTAHDLLKSKSGVPSRLIDNTLITPNASFCGELPDSCNFEIKLCFSNKGRTSGLNAGGTHYQNLSKEDALRKLGKRLCGAAEVISTGDIWYIHQPIEAGIKRRVSDFRNSFIVSGTLKVTDNDKLIELIKSGIGSRKSYGFGLLILKK